MDSFVIIMTRKLLILMMCSFIGSIVILVNNILWTFRILPKGLSMSIDAIVVVVLIYNCYYLYKYGITRLEESKKQYDRLKELERQFKADYGVDLDLTTGLKRS